MEEDTKSLKPDENSKTTVPSKININYMGISVLPIIEEKISVFGDKSLLIISNSNSVD